MSLRAGQAAFNALCIATPEIAEEIRGGADDPFHDNARLPRFFARVLEIVARDARRAAHASTLAMALRDMIAVSTHPGSAALANARNALAEYDAAALPARAVKVGDGHP